MFLSLWNVLIGMLHIWLLGTLYAAKCCLQTVYICYRAVKVYVLPKLWPKQDFHAKYGDWAGIFEIIKSFCWFCK